MRIIRIAAALAVITQSIFLARYYYLTDGCFCAVTGVGIDYREPVRGEIAFLQTVSLPAKLLPVGPLPIDERWRTVFLTAINTLVWFAGLTVVLCLAQAVWARLFTPRARPSGWPADAA